VAPPGGSHSRDVYDGLVNAGERIWQPVGCVAIRSKAILEEQDPSAQEIADALLSHAIPVGPGPALMMT